MVAELVRPDVSGADWGGFDLDRLRIAGLARAVQTRLPYLHHCICREDGPIVTPDGRPMTLSETAFGFRFWRPLFISNGVRANYLDPSGTPLYCLKNRAACRSGKGVEPERGPGKG